MRYFLIFLSLLFVSCVCVRNSININPNIKKEYLKSHSYKDKYFYAVYNGTIKKGMNLEELRAALSRDDIAFELQEDSAGNFILDEYYVTRGWEILNVFPMFSWASTTLHTKKYYFSKGILDNIVRKSKYNLGNFNTTIKSKGDNSYD
jgi:hypothetical protein